MSVNEVEELKVKAMQIREVFVQMLASSINTERTIGTCLYATYLLKQVFDSFTPYQSVPRGGDGQLDGGYRDNKGNLHGHYWLEVSIANSDYIVDITADQFGGPPVVVQPLKDSENYIAGNPKKIKDHFDEFSKSQ